MCAQLFQDISNPRPSWMRRQCKTNRNPSALLNLFNLTALLEVPFELPSHQWSPYWHLSRTSPGSTDTQENLWLSAFYCYQGCSSSQDMSNWEKDLELSSGYFLYHWHFISKHLRFLLCISTIYMDWWIRKHLKNNIRELYWQPQL